MSIVAPHSDAGDVATGAPSLAAHRYRWAAEAVVVGVAVAAGLALRAFARSDLWLDEALSVNIARLRPGDIVEALRHDGHPPLYYFLLHGWMKMFGSSDAAVRALSGVISAATLPLIWRAGKELGGRRCAIAALVLMATSPQAVRYGTETRMYALVVLLATIGWLSVRASLRKPTLGRLAAVAACSGLLLLTHYWSLYLLAGTVCVLAWAGLRGRVDVRMPARRTLGAVMVGVLVFVPWIPVLLDQITSTGTPWASPARPAQVIVSLLAGNDTTGEATLLGVVLALLVGLGLCGRPDGEHHIELDIRTRQGVRAEAMLLTLVLAFGALGGYVGAVAFTSRYTAVIFPVLMLLAAMGIARLPSKRARMSVIAVASTLGLVASLHVAVQSRTQLGDVGRALGRHSRPGDFLIHCPDQLAPAVLRYAPTGLVNMTYPQTSTPQRIEWVHYRFRVDQVDPTTFAKLVEARARHRVVWLVWSEGYPLLGRRCEEILATLSDLRRHHDIAVSPAGSGERAWLYRFYPR